MFLDKVLRPMKPYSPPTVLSVFLVVVSPATDLIYLSNSGSDPYPAENGYLLCAVVRVYVHACVRVFGSTRNKNE